MSSPTAERTRKRRAALRAAGMRPLQIWVPDTRRKSFAAACRKQADLLDRAAADIEGWNR